MLAAVVVAGLTLAACGGSDTTASTSPPSTPSPEVAESPSGVPLPTPTIAGTIAFTNVSVTESDDADICVTRTDGTGLMQLTDDPGWEEHPSWAPDGERIVYDAGSSYPLSNRIWVMNADGSGKTKLTHGYHPHWSPDGRHIVFVRHMGGSRGEDVFVMNADGGGVRRMIDLSPDDTDPSWAPDGRIVSTLGRDVFAMDLDGGDRVRRSGHPRCATSI
jgi:Tol biopolymer transport system component